MTLLKETYNEKNFNLKMRNELYVIERVTKLQYCTEEATMYLL